VDVYAGTRLRERFCKSNDLGGSLVGPQWQHGPHSLTLPRARSSSEEQTSAHLSAKLSTIHLWQMRACRCSTPGGWLVALEPDQPTRSVEGAVREEGVNPMGLIVVGLGEHLTDIGAFDLPLLALPRRISTTIELAPKVNAEGGGRLPTGYREDRQARRA
jgi:hypothetical protein